MRTLLRSTDHSFIESVRLALEAEGITVILEHASAAALPFIPMTLHVAEEDFDHAQEVVRGLRPPLSLVQEGRWSLRSWRTAVIAFLVLTILLLKRILLH